jgi:hypothetical protein
MASITLWQRFTPGKRNPGTHCVGSWMDLTPSLDTEARGKIFCLSLPLMEPISELCGFFVRQLLKLKGALHSMFNDSHRNIPFFPANERMFCDIPSLTNRLNQNFDLRRDEWLWDPSAADSPANHFTQKKNACRSSCKMSVIVARC